ncbi:MAG: QueT transporter family protein [Coriobacteriia bacterium]
MVTTRHIARAGLIAAVYAALTLLVLQLPGQLGWGPVQFRASEAVTVIAVLTPSAVPGLWLGAVAANAFMFTQVGPVALLDVVFGSLGTLAGAAWTWRFRRRRALALAGPVVANALIVPAYLPFLLRGLGFYTLPFVGTSIEGSWPAMYAFGVIAVGIGEAAVVYGLGWPLLVALDRLGIGRLLGDEAGSASPGNERGGGGDHARGAALDE